MKTTITRSEYYALCGVLELGQFHAQKTREFQTCAKSLLGIRTAREIGDPASVASDRVDDMIWGREKWDAEDLLRRLGIAVEESDGEA